jgi:pimeloyl-ACP methyl ester carboxylesterase
MRSGLRGAAPSAGPAAPDLSLVDVPLAVEHVPGGSPRLLLIHPVGLDRGVWKGLLPYLGGRYELLLVDLPGHGESGKPPNGTYSLRAFAERCLRLLDEAGWEDAVWVGNSLGGGVSLAAAIRAPERVRGLALLDSVGFRRDLPLLGHLAQTPVAAAICRWANPLTVGLSLRLVRRAGSPASPDQVRRAASYLQCPSGRSAFLATVRALHGPELDTLSPHYGSIRCPSLILQGRWDPLIRPGHAARLANALSNATLVSLPDCGHFPADERPEVVGPLLRQFLDPLGAAGWLETQGLNGAPRRDQDEVQ